jgi:galactokinase
MQHDTADNAVRLMRVDFEITVPAIDDLLAVLQNTIGKQGWARMTGEVFGDATMAVMLERPGPGVSIL